MPFPPWCATIFSILSKGIYGERGKDGNRIAKVQRLQTLSHQTCLGLGWYDGKVLMGCPLHSHNALFHWTTMILHITHTYTHTQHTETRPAKIVFSLRQTHNIRYIRLCAISRIRCSFHFQIYATYLYIHCRNVVIRDRGKCVVCSAEKPISWRHREMAFFGIIFERRWICSANYTQL